MDIAIQKHKNIHIYLSRQTLIRALLFYKVLTIILAKYSDYINIFSKKYVVEFSKYNWLNDYIIK